MSDFRSTPPASDAPRSERRVLSLGGRRAAPSPEMAWKCKPCGARFEPSEAQEADSPHVRCPNCRAKLGLLADFLLEPPPMERLRARQATVKPPAVAPVERKPVTVQIKRRSVLAPARGPGLRRAP